MRPSRAASGASEAAGSRRRRALAACTPSTSPRQRHRRASARAWWDRCGTVVGPLWDRGGTVVDRGGTTRLLAARLRARELLSERAQKLRERVLAVDGHDVGAHGVGGGVEGDRQAGGALAEEAAHLGHQAGGGDGDLSADTKCDKKVKKRQKRDTKRDIKATQKLTGDNRRRLTASSFAVQNVAAEPSFCISLKLATVSSDNIGGSRAAISGRQNCRNAGACKSGRL